MRNVSDPYAELGVPRDATQAEITHAFRRLLRLHHPDTRPLDGMSDEDSASTLRRVIAAYAAISQDRSSDAGGRSESPTPSVPVPTRSRVIDPAVKDAIRAGPIRWSPMG